MNKTFTKNIIRTIFGSMGRFIAIVAIIALGSGFFAGLKVTKEAMIKTADEYIGEYKLFDYRLVSTLGFEQQEVDKIAAINGVSAASGSYSLDFTEGDSAQVIRAQAMTDGVNELCVISGRLPQADNECVVDAKFAPDKNATDSIVLSDGNDKSVFDNLKYDKYKVVGVVKTPLYMSNERGSSTIGSGMVNGFIYIPYEGFSVDCFSEIYVKLSQSPHIYTEEYDNLIDEYEDVLQNQLDKAGEERREKIVSEALPELDDKRAEYDDGRKEYDDGLVEYNDGLKKYNDGLMQYMDNKRAADEGYAETEKTLADSKKQLDSAKQTLDATKQTIDQNEQQYTVALYGYNEQAQQYNDLIAAYGENEQTAAAKQQLDATAQTLLATRAQLDALQQQYTAGFSEYESGMAQYENGMTQYNESKKKTEKQLAEAKAKLDDSKAELDDAAVKLDDAQMEIDDIKQATTLLLNRSSNTGYAGFDSNSSIVDGVARVFPLFFFLIAALVCSTTMTRMIDDDRTQIGTLRALGFTSTAVMLKYIIYSGTAALLGCVLGVTLGSLLFPSAIWHAYGMLYGFSELQLVFNIGYALISLAGALLCSVGTTVIACRHTLGCVPAKLIRPKSPGAGKRILLEKWGFVWNKLKFLHKVTIRNIFRFKKRMLMMIVGIAGCTALVLTGFGVKDSVSNIVNYQFDDVMKYDAEVSFTDVIDDTMKKQIAADYPDIKAINYNQQTSVDLECGDKIKSIYMVVTDSDSINDLVNFSRNDKKIAYPSTGEAIISDKTAALAGISVGDSFVVRYGDSKEVTLKATGIFENYVFNYIFISDDTFIQDFNEPYHPKAAYVSFEDNADITENTNSLGKHDGVLSISVVSQLRTRVQDMMNSMNYIVWLVISCAAALAFVVLFNLGNINITERVREIATLKVLGFFPRETGAYVFRESIVLSMMGAAVGLPLGVIFHNFVMSQINIDLVTFKNHIEPLSFLYTILAVILFTVAVDLVLRRKIARISMADSLKSIE